MIVFLRIAFILVLAAMFGVTAWASNFIALWETPREMWQHPWIIATLADTYFGFLTFYCWVAYKETSNVARIAWLLAILALGNIAMAIYMLWRLFKLPADAKIEALLLREK